MSYTGGSGPSMQNLYAQWDKQYKDLTDQLDNGAGAGLNSKQRWLDSQMQGSADRTAWANRDNTVGNARITDAFYMWKNGKQPYAAPPPAAPVAPVPVSQTAPPAPVLDTALLDRLEEKIMGESLARRTNSLRESQNQRGVFHSSPASEQDRRVRENARDQYQAGQMSLMADQSSMEMRRLQQMQNMLGQQTNQANQQYKGAYDKYTNDYGNWQNQQNSYSQLLANGQPKTGGVLNSLSGLTNWNTKKSGSTSGMAAGLSFATSPTLSRPSILG